MVQVQHILRFTPDGSNPLPRQWDRATRRRSYDRLASGRPSRPHFSWPYREFSGHIGALLYVPNAPLTKDVLLKVTLSRRSIRGLTVPIKPKCDATEQNVHELDTLALAGVSKMNAAKWPIPLISRLPYPSVQNEPQALSRAGGLSAVQIDVQQSG